MSAWSGDRLKQLRKAAGLTQAELAEKVGSHTITVSRWETDEREPTWTNIAALAKALGVDCTAFLPPADVEEKEGSKMSAWNGARLRELRVAAGLSQSALAERAGVTRDTVAQWEANNREPIWTNVVALAKALGVDCSAFLEEADGEEAGGGGQ